MRFPIPSGQPSLAGLQSWGQSLQRQLESAFDALTRSVQGAAQATTTLAAQPPPMSYVPLTFAGSPLVFVTDSPGNLIFVGFAPP